MATLTRKLTTVPSRSRLGQDTICIGLGALLAVTLAAHGMMGADRDPQDRDEARRKAVLAYFETAARVVTPEEKLGVPRTVEVREVSGWPFQDRIHGHVLMVAIVKTGYARYRLVAVDNSLAVWEIKDRDDFNQLLRREGLLIKTAEDAGLAAKLFLSATRIGYLLDSGWELGVNVVRSPEDITYRDEADRERLIRSVKLQGPKVSAIDDGYEFSVYGWEKVGSGAVKRYRVLLSERGVKDLGIDHLLGNVGAWEPLM